MSEENCLADLESKNGAWRSVTTAVETWLIGMGELVETHEQKLVFRQTKEMLEEIVDAIHVDDVTDEDE